METPSKIIGSNIRKKREEMGFSQNELANRIGLTIKSLSQIENGHSQARRSNLEALANALKCSINDFYVSGSNDSEKADNSSVLQEIRDLKKDLHGAGDLSQIVAEIKELRSDIKAIDLKPEVARLASLANDFSPRGLDKLRVAINNIARSEVRSSRLTKPNNVKKKG